MGNPYMGILVDSKDIDVLLQNEAFHQGLHCSKTLFA